MTDAKIKTSRKSQGQCAYEADLVQRPNYVDGGKRPTWSKLPKWKQLTWEPPFGVKLL